MPYRLGIDLGGTKVLAGVIDVKDGRILGRAKKRSHADHGPEDLIKRMLKAGEEAIDESGVKGGDISAVGIGVAGQIDHNAGVILKAPNLAGMANTPLAEITRKHFDKPASLFNDVEAAAAGEAAFGAGRDEKD